MSKLTNQEIEQLKQLLKQKQEECREIINKLIDAGECPLDDEDLDEVAGGVRPGEGVVGPATYGVVDSFPYIPGP